MSRINGILNRGIIIDVMYTTMVTCVFILTFKLYQASKIRRSCTTGLTRASDQAPDKPVAQGLSSKDIRAMKSVVLVCTTFILAQLSFLIYSTVRLFRPDFTNGQHLRYLFAISGQISATCSYLNESLNIFVYYNYNTSYRSFLPFITTCEKRSFKVGFENTFRHGHILRFTSHLKIGNDNLYKTMTVFIFECANL